jgi:hypothetical protein
MMIRFMGGKGRTLFDFEEMGDRVLLVNKCAIAV